MNSRQSQFVFGCSLFIYLTLCSVMSIAGRRRFVPVPPEKGSFPLDHDGVCKDFMTKYMKCLKKTKSKNTSCREESKEYLNCRMKHNLMAPEEWSHLGYPNETPSKDAEKAKTCILIGCTGSVATIKLGQLVSQLIDGAGSRQVEIRIVATQHSKHFFDVKDIPKNTKIFYDDDEWSVWKVRGDPVLHIELTKWADVFVIAPLDANTLAKMAQGLCDNLLTCIVRAWNIEKPLLFCPAMNTHMWAHPITTTHIETLKKWGYQEIPCISKTLMCGDTGLGAMAETDTIVTAVWKIIQKIL